MYDFVTEVNRRKTGSFKWDQIDAEMGDSGADIIAMSTADMELLVAPEITDALMKTVKSGVYGYTVPTASYYDAALGWQERRHHWSPKKEWMTCTPGVVPALFHAVAALTHPGDKVLIQEPIYYPFFKAVQCNGCEVVSNPLIRHADNSYAIDFEDLEKKAADSRVRVLLLCSPHNPVGRVWKRDELERIAEICLRHHVVIVADEIHNDLVFKPHKHTVFATLSKEAEQNCLVLTAPSKTFNLAGLQNSIVYTPNRFIKERFDAAVANSAADFLNMFGYRACEAAYTHAEKWLDELLVHIESNKLFFNNFMKNNLPRLPVTELEGTYLMWFDCRALGMNAMKLERFMKDEVRVYFDEGYIFGKGGEGFERINIACPRAVLERVMNNLSAAIKRHA